jgi:hypothetical protein
VGSKLVLCGVEHKKMLVMKTHCLVRLFWNSVSTTGFEKRATFAKYISVTTYMAHKYFQIEDSNWPQ